MADSMKNLTEYDIPDSYLACIPRELDYLFRKHGNKVLEELAEIWGYSKAVIYTRKAKIEGKKIKCAALAGDESSAFCDYRLVSLQITETRKGKKSKTCKANMKIDMFCSFSKRMHDAMGRELMAKCLNVNYEPTEKSLKWEK